MNVSLKGSLGVDVIEC